MPVFAYAGRGRGGQPISGELDAADKDTALSQLRSQGITAITKIEPKKAPKAGKKQKVTDKDLVIFTRQFATMIDAGLPLVQCLEILSAQCDNKTLGALLGTVKMDVESGTTYADALKKHPKVFSNLYCNMVQAGEVGGILDTILQRLAKQMEKDAKLKAQVKSAMVYPASIVGVAIIVVSVLLVWVIPIFAKMFTDFGGALPGPTLLVIGASNFVQTYWYIVFGIPVAGLYALKKYYDTPAGRLKLDTIALKLPVAGDLIRKISVAQFTRTFGTLLQSGVPIMDGLEIVARVAGNVVVQNAIMAARTSVGEGKNLADPIGKTGVFPPMVVQMISVGEATGALDAMLSKIADFYDEEVDAAVSALTSLLEPMLMVFLGTVIGFIVIAMYLPIFKMASAIG